MRFNIRFKFSMLFLFFSSITVFSQANAEKLLVSLENVKTETEKLEILMKMTDHFMENENVEQAIVYGEKALAIVESSDSQKINHDLVLKLIDCYQQNDEFEKALSLSIDGAEFFLKEGHYENYCIFLEETGYSFWNLQQYQLALEKYNESIKVREKTNYKDNLANIFNSLGMIYSELNSHDTALEMFFKSLNEEGIADRDKGRSLNSIGVVYFRMNNFEKALEYYSKALDFAEKKDDKREMADVLNNIGVVYQSMEDFPLAENYYSRSLDIEKAENNRLGICDGLNNLGEVKSETGDLNAALKYFQDSLEIAEEFGDHWRIADSLRNIAGIYRQNEDLETAANLIEKALVKGHLSGDKSLLRDVFSEMALIYENSGFFKKAYAAQVNYKTLNEELISEAAVRSAMEFDVKYQAEKSAKEIEILKKDRKIQKMLTLSMGIGIVGGLVFIILLYRNYRIKLKANREIREKNSALTEARDKLEQLARTDTLTGLSNRRDMMEKISVEKTRFERSKKLFTIVISDIDRFKTFNDTYGHDCGDYVLQSVAEILKTSIRKQDAIARWGGEEFLFLLPETTLEGGKQLAEKLRQKIETETYLYNNTPLNITMTFGVAEYNSDLIEPCINDADRALYKGKEMGRNCVVVSE